MIGSRLMKVLKINTSTIEQEILDNRLQETSSAIVRSLITEMAGNKSTTIGGFSMFFRINDIIHDELKI